MGGHQILIKQKLCVIGAWSLRMIGNQTAAPSGPGTVAGEVAGGRISQVDPLEGTDELIFMVVTAENRHDISGVSYHGEFTGILLRAADGLV